MHMGHHCQHCECSTQQLTMTICRTDTQAQYEASRQTLQKQLQAAQAAAASEQARHEQQLTSRCRQHEADEARFGSQLAALTKQLCALAGHNVNWLCRCLGCPAAMCQAFSVRQAASTK